MTSPLRNTRELDADLFASITAALNIPKRIVLPTSWVGHIPFASWIIPALEPRVVVELGVHTGNSFFTFAEAASRAGLPTHLYGIDTWAGDEHAGAYAEDVLTDVRSTAQTRFPETVHLLRKRFDEALRDFEESSVDLLHIDGLHTYEAVRNDFETWESKLSDRAVVVFHDIAVRKEGFGVHQYWSEVRQRYPHFAFTHSNGLGVLLVGEFVPSIVRRLSEDSRDRDEALALFDKLGSLFMKALEHGPDVEALPVSASLDPPRIYLSTDGSFNEDLAMDARPIVAAPGALQSTFGPIVNSDRLQLRIDPLSHVGIRGIHRILVTSEGRKAPLELTPTTLDTRIRLSIVPVDKGLLFVGTGEDSQWFPVLDSGVRDCFREGATIVFEPIAASASAISRMLLNAIRELTAPLDAQIEELKVLESMHQTGRSEDQITIADLQQRWNETTGALTRLEAEREVLDRERAVWIVERTTWATNQTAWLEEKARLQEALAQSNDEKEVLALNVKSDRERFETDIEDARQRARALEATFEQRLLAREDELESLLVTLKAATRERDPSEPVVVQIEGAFKQWTNADDARSRRVVELLKHLVYSGEMLKGKLMIEQVKSRLSLRLSRIATLNARQTLFLEPINDLVPLDAQCRRWLSLGDDPQFAFDQLLNYVGRWVELSLTLTFDGEPSRGPVLYLDHGEGMSERNTVPIPMGAPDSGYASMVFMVPTNLRGARFDPCAANVTFTLTNIRIKTLSKFQAIRVMTRTMRNSGRLRNLRDTFVPQWRRMHSAKARQELKNAFVESYRSMLLTRSYSYNEWIQLFEPPQSSYAHIGAQRLSWSRQPLISILMPTYETPIKYLRSAIQSVIEQHYPHWELCIADDASKSPQIRRLLEKFAAADPRVKITIRATNGHISAASNSALELATGEFVALLDHDDRLHPLALHYLAEALVANPGTSILFSDEDKLDVNGLRSGPYFKCEFNYDLFLAQNMVSHLGCFNTEIVRAVGGFRLGLEGSQDWDLALRVLDVSGPASVRHIPRVLYHWRQIPGSTAVAIDEKPYAHIAGRRAVIEHLERNGIDATVEPAPGMPAWNRVRYTLPETSPKVSIIIPTRDKVAILRTCIESVLTKSTYSNFDIIVVDNGSVEFETVSYLASLPPERVTVIRDDAPFNYSRINNRAVEQSTGDLICLLNNDIEVLTPGWLEEMVSIALQPNVGVVGAMLWYPDLRVQHGGVILGIGGIAAHAHKLTPKGHLGYFGRAGLQQQMSAVTGACLLTSRSLWSLLGGLDEAFEVAFNDIDLCLRASRLGYKTVWTPFAELIHHESISRGMDDTPEKLMRFESEQALMRARWGDILDHDPFYSPNLTLLAEDFSLSWDPRDPSTRSQTQWRRA